MAGKIRDEDIALVRERTSIVDVISEHLTLKSAGGGNVKGLCPFHDEKTPSFTVSSARNVYFCHGCGAGGDAIRFVMDVDHLTFVEAVERLAARAGVAAALRRVRAGAGAAPEPGPEAAPGRRARGGGRVLRRRSWPRRRAGGPRVPRPARLRPRGGRRRTAAASPRRAGTRWSSTCGRRASPAQELVAAGLAKQARSGSLIDRFRRRLIWPIRDLTGDVIGFGARKLFDDDDGPKYLNTPETPLYKKSHVLYGIDHAKREIARQGRAVIVEGYTDVMACHLAGVPTAVATCGTAFGADHIGVLRRLLMDTDTLRRRDHLHLRRRRRRAEGGAAGVRGRPAVRRADVHRGQPGQHGPVRAAAGQGRRGGARPGRPPGAADRVRAALACSRATTWTPPRAGSPRCARPRRWSRRSRTGRCARSTPASSPATSAWRSSR